MYLQPKDLTPFADVDDEKAAAMIEDAEATAIVVAPCIAEPEFRENATRSAYVKAVIRGAVLRWNESGTGAFQTQTAGPFSVGMDTRQQRRGMFWPSEIEQLQEACRAYRDPTGESGGAATISMIPGASTFDPLVDAVINRPEEGPRPVGEWSDERVTIPQGWLE